MPRSALAHAIIQPSPITPLCTQAAFDQRSRQYREEMQCVHQEMQAVVVVVVSGHGVTAWRVAPLDPDLALRVQGPASARNIHPRQFVQRASWHVDVTRAALSRF